MQLGDPTVLETSSGEALGVAVNSNSGGVEEKGIIVRREDDSGGGGHGGVGDDESHHEKINGRGNRWPRQETLALLKIRSDMDAVFRDSSLKGPLWEDVSRKLADLGYHRSAKKCKEKFENVYKYHKRTKESRSGKSEGKTYRFFDQLQALEKQFTHSSYPPKPQPQPQPPLATPNTNTLALPTRPSDSSAPISYITTTTTTTTIPPSNPTLISPPPPPPPLPTTTTNVTTNITCPTTVTPNPSNDNNNNNNVSYSLPNMNLFSSTSSTSSTASDEDLKEKYRKKRKWKDYFRRLTRQVLAKQEEMQKKFLEAIDKREREQIERQDNWRTQEMARINREHELLVQERTMATSKDVALVVFLQKLSGQQNLTTQHVVTADQTTSAKIIMPSSLTSPSLPPSVSHVVEPSPQPQPQPPPQQQKQQQLPLMVINNNNVEIQKAINGHNGDGGGGGGPLNSPSRWPKAEVHALIRLRTSLEAKYQENAPKAPLWEDISAGMQRLGYNRSAKRCKEKWENINKYFKKVKESSKKRREDSKTCPYYEELDAIYKEKTKTASHNNNNNPFVGGNSTSLFHNMMIKPNEMMEPLMVQPEQQWRPPPCEHDETMKGNNVGQKREREEEEKGDSMEDDHMDGEDDDDDGDGGCEEGGESMEDEGGDNNRYEIATCGHS